MLQLSLPVRFCLLICVSSCLVAGCSKTKPNESGQGSSDATQNGKDSGPDKPGIALNERLTSVFTNLPDPLNPGNPVTLKFKPKTGDVWNYKVRNELKMNSLGMNSSDSSNADLSFTFDLVSGESFEVTGRVPRIRSQLQTATGGYSVDTDEPGNNQISPGFESFASIWQVVSDASASFQVDSSGAISNLETPAEIQHAISGNGNSEMLGLTTDVFMSNYIAAFTTLPKSPVSVGDQWQITSPLNPLNTQNNIKTAQFIGTNQVDGRLVALIEITSEHSLPEKGNMVEDMEIKTITLLQFDLEGGFISRMDTVGDMELSLNINNRTIPQKSELTNTMSRVDR